MTQTVHSSMKVTTCTTPVRKYSRWDFVAASYHVVLCIDYSIIVTAYVFMIIMAHFAYTTARYVAILSLWNKRRSSAQCACLPVKILSTGTQLYTKHPIWKGLWYMSYFSVTFNPPHLHLASLSCDIIWILQRSLASNRLSPWATMWHFLCDHLFSRSNRTATCDGQTKAYCIPCYHSIML